MTFGLNYIDYDKLAFIQESVLIMYYTKGGMDLRTLEEIPFQDFLLYVTEAKRIENLQSSEEGDSADG